MIAVIFEAWPNDGRTKEYLDIAANLRPWLDTIDGFISIERFESLTEPGKILSLSFWRDEEAIEKWRQIEDKSGIFLRPAHPSSIIAANDRASPTHTTENSYYEYRGLPQSIM